MKRKSKTFHWMYWKIPKDNENWEAVKDYFYLTMPKSAIIQSIKRIDDTKDLLEDHVTKLPAGRERLDNQFLHRLLWYPTSERPKTIRQEGFKPGNRDFWGKHPIYFTNSALSASRIATRSGRPSRSKKKTYTGSSIYRTILSVSG